MQLSASAKFRTLHSCIPHGGKRITRTIRNSGNGDLNGEFDCKHLFHAGTEHEEYIQIIITSTQEEDNVIPSLVRYLVKS